ncbi:MAG TPA: hypothetical protein PLV25_06920, partial [Opitutales bacterium]|nr:hypothetical protein [Opitutales bacterium]
LLQVFGAGDMPLPELPVAMELQALGVPAPVDLPATAANATTAPVGQPIDWAALNGDFTVRPLLLMLQNLDWEGAEAWYVERGRPALAPSLWMNIVGYWQFAVRAGFIQVGVLRENVLGRYTARSMFSRELIFLATI